MRGARSFLVLLVIAIGLGAYIYFVESGRDPLADDRETLLDIDPDAVDEISITAADGTLTRLTRTDDAWQIVEPVAADADETQVTSLLSALDALRIERVVDESPASVDAYGLAPPQATVAFRTTGAGETSSLHLGNRTPTGADLYAQVEGSPRLLLIAAYVETQIVRTAFDLRDKTILALDAGSIETVTLDASGADPVRLTKSGIDWRLEAPVAAPADSSGVDAIVNAAAQARMQSVAAEQAPADLSPFGLDRPRAIARFGAEGAEATLAFGADAGEGRVFARDVDRPLVFTVDQALFDRLTPAVDDLRIHDIFAMRSFTATGLDLSLAGQTFSFTKDVPAADGADRPVADTWSMTQPEARDVETPAITAVLNGLAGLRAETFVSRAPAEGDRLEVTARFGDASAPTEEQVTLRWSGETAYAIRSGEPGAAVVPATDVEAIVTDIRELTGLP